MATIPDCKRRRTDEQKASEIPPWGSLPSDILLVIFNYLAVTDLVYGVCLTCTSWYNATKDPFLWKSVDFRGFPEEPSEAIEAVIEKSGGSLQAIKFPESSELDDLLLVAKKCPRLKRFSMYQFHDDKEMFCEAVSQMKELECMEVMACYFSDKRIIHQIGRNCPNLTVLKLHCLLRKDTALNIVTFLPKLKEVYINGTIYFQDFLHLLNLCTYTEIDTIYVGPKKFTIVHPNFLYSTLYKS